MALPWVSGERQARCSEPDRFSPSAELITKGLSGFCVQFFDHAQNLQVPYTGYVTYINYIQIK